MKTKVLLLLTAAALGISASPRANAYVGFRLNLALPLYYPYTGYYYPAAGYPSTVVYNSPPRAEGERVTVAPGPGYVWIAGHWTNSAQRWVWLAGRWELPPSPSAAWVAGHWAQGATGWIWVNDMWAVGGAATQPMNPPVPPGSSTGPSAPPEPPAAQAIPQAAPAPSTPAPPVTEMTDGAVVPDEPPAPIAEYVPASPYPDYIWVGGFWGWRGSWYWNAGHYAPRPFHGAVWVSGGWARGGRGWAWHGGRWR